MDISSAISAGFTGATADFEANLAAVAAVLIPLLVGGLIVRRALRFIR